MDFQNILKLASDFAEEHQFATYGLKIITALFTLWIGWKLVNIICKGLRRWFEKAEYD